MSGHFTDDCRTHQLWLAANITFTRWWHSHPPKKTFLRVSSTFFCFFSHQTWCRVTLVIMGYGWTDLADFLKSNLITKSDVIPAFLNSKLVLNLRTKTRWMWASCVWWTWRGVSAPAEPERRAVAFGKQVASIGVIFCLQTTQTFLIITLSGDESAFCHMSR